MTNSIVHIDRLTHAYGQRVALDNLSLHVNTGEIFGLLGPNGSGKTTLFRILSTLIPVSNGEVKIFGQNLSTAKDEIRRQMGVVFQSPSLDKQLTAEENLMHHGHLYGLRGSELKSRIDNLLGRLNLADRRHERVGKFSGGMRRRVELAKGLLNRPRLLLMDEPSTGLDPGARIDLWHYLLEIQKNDGVTILMTTHLMDEADRCNRLAILDKGKLLACDTPAAMKQSIGGDVITIASSDVPALQIVLKEKFDLRADAIEGTLRLERDRGYEFVPRLIEAAPGLIQSISVGQPTLEDVFIRTTGHTFSDGV